MRKLTALLLSTLTLCFVSLALAESAGWGTMTIDGRDADRVHLRGAPSIDAPSLGLYFTGTQVECLSDPSQEWVDVTIGTESGFIKSEYLTEGAVSPALPIGVVTTDSYVNFRQAPSKQYEVIGQLRDGTALTIFGETADNWYYAAHGSLRGYVMADYVTLGQPAATGTPSVSAGTTTVTIDLEDSLMAYVSATNCQVYVHTTDDDFITCAYDPALLRLDASTARGTNILFFDSVSSTPLTNDTMAAHVYLPKAYYHSVELSVTNGVGYLNGAVDADFVIYGSEGEVNLDIPTDYAHHALVSLSRSTMGVSLSESLTNYTIRMDEVTGSVVDVSDLYGVPAHHPSADYYYYTAGTGDAQLVFEVVRDSTVEFTIIADRFTADP